MIPALSMRLWAEERKSGTVELFLTLPIRLFEAVLGKFLAAWCFAGIALALTFPFWLTVNFLGEPDNGVILASYLGRWLMAGAVLAIGAAVSAATKNQVIAFIVTATLVFVLIAAGTSTVLGYSRLGSRGTARRDRRSRHSRPFRGNHARRYRPARRRLFPVADDRVSRRQRDPDRPQEGRLTWRGAAAPSKHAGSVADRGWSASR